MRRNNFDSMTNEDLALAFELKEFGCRIKNIAYAFSVSPWTLYQALKKAELTGMRKE